MVVDICVGVDFAADHDVAGLGESLAGDFGAGILLEVGIEDGV